jgi:hypothetical protein
MQLCLRQKYPAWKAMKAPLGKKPHIRIAVMDSDPLQLVGFRAVFHSERDLELISSSLLDVGTQQKIDLVLLVDRSSQNLFDVMATLKATRPNLRTIVIGSGMDDETISSEHDPLKQRLTFPEAGKHNPLSAGLK